uniref:Cylicin_N domain-containing protein n=1 Tax=Steinernema glaseri TaxID=37863 RepID=A0A1I7ZSM7_9BILA
MTKTSSPLLLNPQGNIVQRSIGLYVQTAIVLATNDAAPTRERRQATVDYKVHPLNSNPNSLYQENAIEINVPLKPQIYTINVDGLAKFLSSQLASAIEDQQKLEEELRKQSSGANQTDGPEGQSTEKPEDENTTKFEQQGPESPEQGTGGGQAVIPEGDKNDQTESPQEDNKNGQTENPQEDKTEKPEEDNKTEEPEEDKTEKPEEENKNGQTEEPKEDKNDQTEKPQEDNKNGQTEEPEEDKNVLTEKPEEDKTEKPEEENKNGQTESPQDDNTEQPPPENNRKKRSLGESTKSPKKYTVELVMKISEVKE